MLCMFCCTCVDPKHNLCSWSEGTSDGGNDSEREKDIFQPSADCTGKGATGLESIECSSDKVGDVIDEVEAEDKTQKSGNDEEEDVKIGEDDESLVEDSDTSQDIEERVSQSQGGFGGQSINQSTNDSSGTSGDQIENTQAIEEGNQSGCEVDGGGCV